MWYYRVSHGLAAGLTWREEREGEARSVLKSGARARTVARRGAGASESNCVAGDCTRAPSKGWRSCGSGAGARWAPLRLPPLRPLRRYPLSRGIHFLACKTVYRAVYTPVNTPARGLAPSAACGAGSRPPAAQAVLSHAELRSTQRCIRSTLGASKIVAVCGEVIHSPANIPVACVHALSERRAPRRHMRLVSRGARGGAAFRCTGCGARRLDLRKQADRFGLAWPALNNRGRAVPGRCATERWQEGGDGRWNVGSGGRRGARRGFTARAAAQECTRSRGCAHIRIQGCTDRYHIYHNAGGAGRLAARHVVSQQGLRLVAGCRRLPPAGAGWCLRHTGSLAAASIAHQREAHGVTRSLARGVDHPQPRAQHHVRLLDMDVLETRGVLEEGHHSLPVLLVNLCNACVVCVVCVL